MDRMTDLPRYQRADVLNSSIEDEADLTEVEVAYASTEKQEIAQLLLPRGTVVCDAVTLSKITKIFPSVDINEADSGLFSSPLEGKRRPSSKTHVLLENDRVEIYRPPNNLLNGNPP